jgi:hypothetical protein
VCAGEPSQVPQHGFSKYESLGRNYAYKDVGPQTAERLEHMLGIFTDMGVEAQIGG